MMKKSRTIFFCALFLAVFFALFAEKSQAAESGGISWNYEAGVLTITGEGDMTDIASAGQAPWNQYASLVTELRVEKGVTRVGERSFYGFTALKSVFLADSVNEIGAHAFGNCASLESVQYPAYLKAIGEGAFNGCASLTSLVLPASCRSLGAYAYASCGGIRSVHLPAALSEVGAYAFFGAVSLESVQLPATLTALEEAVFRGCVSLSAISLPTPLTSIGDYAFFGCRALMSLPLPAEVTYIGSYAFAESGISSMHLPDKVSKIGAYAFQSCTELVNLTLPKTLKSVPDGLCLSCKKLESIELPVTLESIGADAFSYCLSLRALTLPANLRSIGAHAFSYGNALEKLTFLSVNCFVAGSTASPVFRGCVALSEVVIGEEVALIPTALFYGLTGLLRVSMGASVREIGASAFEGCTSLSEISLPSSLGRVGESAFYRCQSLKTLYLPSSITVAGRYAFYTDEGGRLFLENERVPSGFADAWRGESYAYFSGEWVSCSFDAAGKTLSLLYLPIGESATEPTVESYEVRKGYTAYFAGWDLNGDGKADSLPLQIWNSFRAVALFREIPNKYNCRFFNDDGTLLAEYSLYYDNEITLPTAPTKPSDGLYEYYFTSWTGYREGMTVSGDHDFTAAYRAVLLDLVPPFAVGIANGETYYAPRSVEIGDEGGLLFVTLDGKEQAVTLGKAYLTLPADGKTHKIIAKDSAGWETVIEVTGVNVSALIDAMPRSDAAVVGAEEELKRVFAEIDELLTKSLANEDKDALAARREELFSAYRASAASFAFSLSADENPLFEEQAFKKAFFHLFSEEEVALSLEGYTVAFEIVVEELSSTRNDESHRALAEEAGKTLKAGYRISLYRSVTDLDGMKKKEEATLFRDVKYKLQLDDEMQEKGTVLILLLGEKQETLAFDEEGSASLVFASPVTLLLLQEPVKGGGRWQTLAILAVAVSLVTSLALAFLARYLVRRRALAAAGKETINADTEFVLDEEGDALIEELYRPSEEELSYEGFSLQDDSFEDEEDSEGELSYAEDLRDDAESELPSDEDEGKSEI